MGELISRALRPWTVLFIVGAVVAFALVVVPGGKPAGAAPLYPAHSVEVDNVGATTLVLSHTKIIPNAYITIQGHGFGKTLGNTLTSVQIDGVDLVLTSDGGKLANVAVSGSGWFWATFAVCPANPADANPALDGGTLEIEIRDSEGFAGTAEVTVLTPKIAVAPYEAKPRQYVNITGANWPAANPDYCGAVSPVKLEVTGSGFDADAMEATVDARGKWSVRYRVPSIVGIPSTIAVRTGSGAPGDIVATTKFIVPPARLYVTPDQVAPCDTLTLHGAGFSPFESDIAVKIGNKDVDVPTTFGDREGYISNLTFIVPNLDAGTYTVQLIVGGARGTVASSKVTVLDDTRGDAVRADALSPSLSVVPDTVVPSGELTLNAAGFPWSRCGSHISVKIGDIQVPILTGTYVYREGKVKNLTVRVPELDAGTYTVRLTVGGDGGTTATAAVTVPEEYVPSDGPLPDALASLGDNLVRVVHFNNATKTWSFYDPRPEFEGLNTLTILSVGEPYWILVRESQRITIDGRDHTFTCQGGDCWNSIRW